MKIINLTQGQKTIVDDDDFEKFGHMGWFACLDSDQKTFYAKKGSPERRLVSLHRLIVGCPPGLVVDHINHKTLDNRKINLRICTHSQNAKNRKGADRDSATRIRGVSWKQFNNNPERGAWIAQIKINGIKKHLGYFKDIEKAKRAYLVANKKYFGDFGILES